jgi:putative acetyltransferase
VQLAGGDERAEIERYLERNPGGSFVAEAAGRVVGVALCGHDGRRGYLHHLAVDAAHRRSGLGRRLAERCLAVLREAGMAKCHLFVAKENEEALAFWRATDWFVRDDLEMLSILLEPERQP